MARKRVETIQPVRNSRLTGKRGEEREQPVRGAALMNSADTPNDTPTEGQIVPPEEQILPSGGGAMPAPEASVTGEQGGSEDQGGDEDQGLAEKAQEAAPEAAQQAQSLARANPTPILLAISFVAGVVVARIASRRR
jgi:hypothetical protein